MSIARSRVTSQGQVSVPAEVRRRLGVGPGSVLAWEEGDGGVVVRRVGQHGSDDIHRALFPDGPPAPRDLRELKASVARHLKAKHARR